MGVVIDASVVALQRAAQDLEAVLAAEPVVIPAMVYAELLVGVRLAQRSDRAESRRAWIDALVTRTGIVDFSRGMAERWADVFVSLRRAGTMIPANDLQVAATALDLDYAVLLAPEADTHFERVPGLRVTRLDL